MERLTMRDAGGRAFWVSPNHPGDGYCLVEDSKDAMRLDRLAAYEETGLMPEEITTGEVWCVFYCNRRCNLDGDWCAEGPGCPWELSPEDAMHLLELYAKQKAESEGGLDRTGLRTPKYGPPQRFPPGLELLLSAGRERPPPEEPAEEQPLIHDSELRCLLLELHDG